MNTMTTEAYSLTPNQVVLLAIMQCAVQGEYHDIPISFVLPVLSKRLQTGLLTPLLVTFLTSKQDCATWFKLYVIAVNVLCLVQTVLHTI